MERVTREFTSDLSQLAAMRALVRDVCARAWGDGADEATARLELAVGEAAANVLLHAYEGHGGHPVFLTVEADPTEARVYLAHEGRTFDPEAVPPPALDGTRECGYGMYLIRECVDEVRYFQNEGGRSGVYLLKKRRAAAPRPDPEGEMQPTVEKIGDVTVVTLNVEALDASNSEDFRQEMGPVLADTRKLVLDLGRVQFMDSRGCGAILSCLKRVSEAGGDLKLCRVARFVRNVLELMRLHRICEICETREEAVRAFAR